MQLGTLTLSTSLLSAQLIKQAIGYIRSIIEYVCSWSTPTVLFCFLNLMIGTILITSSLKKDRAKQGEDMINLPPNPLLQRVRSAPLTTGNSWPHFGQSPSLLQRVRSINFSFSRSEKPSLFPSLDQYADDPAEESETATEEEDDLQIHVRRSKSTMSVGNTMKKLASIEMLADKAKRGTKSFGGDDEAMDSKADDFINKFREQLKMQRIDSILRWKLMFLPVTEATADAPTATYTTSSTTANLILRFDILFADSASLQR